MMDYVLLPLWYLRQSTGLGRHVSEISKVPKIRYSTVCTYGVVYTYSLLKYLRT